MHESRVINHKGAISPLVKRCCFMFPEALVQLTNGDTEFAVIHQRFAIGRKAIDRARPMCS